MKLEDRKENLAHWDTEGVESMYDKHLLQAEIELIKRRIKPNSSILDVGCGEGEGTLVYSSIPGATIDAIDFSDTRLEKATERLEDCRNVTLQKVDLLEPYSLPGDYDAIVSQRFLINLLTWEAQQKVLSDLVVMLKPGGKLLTLEGSQQGVDSLNEFRALLGLEPIPVKWHNLFFSEKLLFKFMEECGCTLAESDGLGAYFLLTRGVRPAFEKKLDWDCEFNKAAADVRAGRFIDNVKCSRLKLWVFQKKTQ